MFLILVIVFKIVIYIYFLLTFYIYHKLSANFSVSSIKSFISCIHFIRKLELFISIHRLLNISSGDLLNHADRNLSLISIINSGFSFIVFCRLFEIMSQLAYEYT